MSQGQPAASFPPNPLTPQQLALVLSEFRNRFGQDPISISLGGSYSQGAATPSSDLDLLIETNLSIPRFSQPWFDFLKAINPGKVPANLTGVGTGPGSTDRRRSR